MKRFIILILTSLLLLPTLLSCGTEQFVLVNYETFELMQKDLPFKMKTIHELENVVVYSGMDKKLGEIMYYISYENGTVSGNLSFRMADAEYAENYGSAFDGMIGISGETAGTEHSKERLGNFEITYYTNGSTIIAVWGDAELSYSVRLSLSASEAAVTPELIKAYVISAVASK